MAAIPILLSLAAPTRAKEPPSPCVVNIPVYNPFGDLLAFQVTSVTSGNDKTRNLLSVEPEGFKTSSHGHTIIFSSDRILNREVEVTLQDAKGAKVSTRFIVISCRLRRSLVLGRSDTGADITGVGMTGRLSGCSFEGDWWVRAVPMFGAQDKAFTADGYVNSEGKLWLVFPDTMRHLVIVGKGKTPLKVLVVDVKGDRPIYLGVVDLTGNCPKE